MLRDKDYKHYPFHFCNIWTSDEKFLSIVSNVWDTKIQGRHMYKLVQQLKLLRKPLREMHKAGFTKMSEQVLNVRDKMLEVQNLLMEDPTNHEFISSMNFWKIEYTRVAAVELKLLKWKAKVRWLHDMDQNSK